MSFAQLIQEAESPASVYRPMSFKVQGRGITSLYVVGSISIADSTDVSTLANGLAVGDVLVEHAGVPAEVGSVVYVEGCGSYNGLRTVTKIIEDSGSPQYLVIGSPNYGDVTPATGRITVWPEGYTVHCELSIYTADAVTPTKVRLRSGGDQLGIATFNVNTVLKDYFASDLSAYVLPIAGGGVVQNAHGTTAIFYRVRFTESWQADTIIDPWDGTHEIESDATDDIATMRVAVNAVHPYESDVLTWSTTNLGGFEVGGSLFARKFLTHAPRGTIGAYQGIKMTLGSGDHFRLFMLSRKDSDFEVDWILRIIDTSGSLIHTEAFSLPDPVAAFCVGVGPADLDGLASLPDTYRVYVSNVSETALSEPVEISIDTTCREVERPMAALNSLGGVDLFTFAGREIEFDGGRRSTVKKPYEEGSGYDYTERTYRNEPFTRYTLSSKPLKNSIRKWVASTFLRSPNVVLKLSDTQAAPVIITTESVESNASNERVKPITIEYRLGVGDLAQVA